MTLYWYSLPTVYAFPTIGSYPVSITTYAPNSSGCGSEQLIDFDLLVSAPPVPGFSYTPGGCVAAPFQFTETTPQFPKPTYHWYWDFGDGVTSTGTRNPLHTYTLPGTYTVRYAAITTPGCLTDTVVQTITVPDLPNAVLSGNNLTACINSATVPTITFSGSLGTPQYIFNYTIDNGSGPGPVIASPPSLGGVVTLTHPTFTAGTFIYNIVSVRNVGTAVCTRNITGQTVTVNILPNHAIALAAGSGPTTQTVCINNPIASISYDLTGGATGATVTGLPLGVTYSVTGKTLTIIGSPNPVFAGASAVYPYTVNTTGNSCVVATASGSITVNADHTLSLNAGSTPTQTVCINTLITPIVYTIGGGASGVTITGLPAGVTFSVVGTTVTINGSPSTTVGSPFSYSINTTGNACVAAPTLSGVLTVNPNHAIALAAGSGPTTQAVCINNPIASISYNLSGGATGATVTGLPAGVIFSVTGTTLTITGSPNPVFAGASAVYPYTVNTTGNSCVVATASGSITVNADHTLSLNAGSTPTQTVCINTLITPIVYTIGGGASGVTITGLPAGVTYTVIGTTVTINGAPSTTVGSPFSYTINTTGNTCVAAPSLSGTLTVNPNHAIALAAGSGPTTQAVCINNPIASISYNLSGGATGATVTGLPLGVTYSVTGTTLNITGSPNPVFAGASAVYPYTVNTTGNSCVVATASGSITVNADHTLSLNAGSTPTQTVCINTLITPIVYTIGGGASGVTITGLPAGVTFSVVGTTVTINGAPSTTVGSPFSYSINTTGNACVAAPTLSGVLTVNPNHAIALAAGSGPTTQAVCINNPIASISYNLSGGATGATVTGLPAGVIFSVTGTTLTITGSPNPVFAGASAVYPYTVNTTGNSCVVATASGSITVNADHTLSLNAGSTPTQTVCISTLITPIVYTIGGGASGVTITGLPAGVTFTVVGTTVTINGAPSTTVGSPFSYTINTTGNACVAAPSLSGTLTVNPNHAIALAAGSGPTTQAVCINNPIASISYNLSGGATGATVTGLPLGVTYSVTGTTLNITGSPNPVFAGASAVYPYTVNTTGNSCVVATASGSITVNADHTLSLNAGSTPTQTVCINTLITPIVYAIGGGATGVNITGLPAGVTYSVVGTTVTISGTPSSTIGTPFNYAVNTTGNTCLTAPPLGGSISVNPFPTALMSGDIEVCQNGPMPSVTFTGANATAPYTFTYSVNGGAPQTVSSVGASSSASVQQSTAVANTFTYTLISVQDGSSTSCTQLQNGTVVVKVNPLPTAAISGAKLVCINSAPPDITFTGAGGTTPYTFTYNINAGTSQTISTTGSNTSVTFSAPTTVAGTFAYNLETVQDGSSTACIQAQTGSAVIVVSDTFPQPNFSIDKPAYCIPNAIVTFSNTSSIADGSSMTYLWNFGDGSTSAAFNPPPHWYGSMGPFNVVLSAQSTTTGCTHDTTIVINNIHPQPKADFTFNKPGICIGDNVTITDNSDGKDGVINQWNWNLGDGSTRTTNSFTHVYTDTITYDVSLYSINNFGCNSDTLTKQFTVHPYPHVNAGPDRFILEGGTITLDPLVFANDAQYVWTPNLYLIDNRVAKVKVNKPLTDMTYRLTVTARGGCSLSDEVFIKLLKFPVIPNTFTPNNDGINDKWRIDYLNTYPDNRVQVFTRNGNLVFESRGYNTPWDGTLKGKPLPFDTYYYIIEPGNGRDPITGYVTIIK